MKRLAIAGVCAAYLFPVAAVAAKKTERVLDVQHVTISNNGTSLTIDAFGDTSTPGWTKETLRVLSASKTELVYEFVGVPPSGIVAQVITLAHARTTWSKAAPLRVRVKAKTNEKAADIPRSESKTKGRPSGMVTVIGKLTGEGVECQAMREDKTNTLYTLTGDLTNFKEGDHVEVTGTQAEISTCMQGTTLVVKSVTKVP